VDHSRALHNVNLRSLVHQNGVAFYQHIEIKKMNDRSKFGVAKTAGKAAAESGMGSAEKVLRVLLAFSPDEPKQTADAIACKVGLPPSSTYRYLSILRKAGFIDDGGGDTYKMAPIVISFARAAYGALDLPERARPYLEQLSADTGESVILVRRSGDRAACIGRVESARQIRYTFEVGTTLALTRVHHPKSCSRTWPCPTKSRLSPMPHRTTRSSRHDWTRFKTSSRRFVTNDGRRVRLRFSRTCTLWQPP
jgi:hypothetical protein